MNKEKIILAFDPAFVKCGLGVISLDGKFIESRQVQLKPNQKMTQSEVDGYVSNNIQKVVDEVFNKYEIEYVVIELQLGQFSATRVQSGIVAALPQDVKYCIQHSKMKLKNDKAKDIQSDNPESNKYNQNKHKGRQLAIQLFPELEKKSFDEYDSLLHAHYALQNLNKIKWFKKSQLQ